MVSGTYIYFEHLFLEKIAHIKKIHILKILLCINQEFQLNTLLKGKYTSSKGNAFNFSPLRIMFAVGETTQRNGMGREEGGGFGMGNMCIPVADSC